MNATIEIMKNRRSCRSYLPNQITDEELNAILEAGLHAPSGMGKQSPIFIVLQDKTIKTELSKINTAHWAKKEKDGYYQAPTIIAVLSNPEICHTYKLDAMASVMNMINAAESLGLGAACVSRAKEVFESEYGQALLDKLGIDKNYVGIEHVAVGYRDGEKQEALKRRENRIFRV